MARNHKGLFQNVVSHKHKSELCDCILGTTEDTASNAVHYLPLALPMHCVHFVDNAEKLAAFATDIRRLVSMAPGIDRASDVIQRRIDFQHFSAVLFMQRKKLCSGLQFKTLDLEISVTSIH